MGVALLAVALAAGVVSGQAAKPFTIEQVLAPADPYKLVSSREERDKGIFKYRDFNRIALSLVEPGGIFVTCSCSGMVPMEEFAFILRGAASNAGRKVQILKKSGAGPDHPVAADYPEGEYLKCIFCRVL